MGFGSHPHGHRHLASQRRLVRNDARPGARRIGPEIRPGRAPAEFAAGAGHRSSAPHGAGHRARAEPGAEPGQRALRIRDPAAPDQAGRAAERAAPQYAQDASATGALDSAAGAPARPGEPPDRGTPDRARARVRRIDQPGPERLDRQLKASRSWTNRPASLHRPAARVPSPSHTKLQNAAPTRGTGKAFASPVRRSATGLSGARPPRAPWAEPISSSLRAFHDA